MGNKIIEAGFGNLLSFISSNTSIGPTIKNFAELNENPQYVKTIVNALQTTGAAYGQ
ncbi:hypothetical protein [Rosenbergiella epipactidis]|uniref:hypothetical protein n=1 Tax=Rosenbergiella epipactidis TaxID=1544694 RepID=UPI001F4F6F27|nr:hypothetical protein [Rosenbergiella epipactidis]